MPNKTRHSRETKNLIYYLYRFGRKKGGQKNFGFLSCERIGKITGVPASTVNKIGLGDL